MYYCVAFFPETDSEGIEAFRSRYDPTASLIDAHLALVFPVPETIGREWLIRHCERILRGWQPFRVSAQTLSKSPDHWLLLDVVDQEGALGELYRGLHSDRLSAYARPELFAPHIGLGHFLKPGSRYDWANPSPEDFDENRYSGAVREARELDLPYSWFLDRLDLVELSDEVIAWATGKEPSLAASASAIRTHTFHLRARIGGNRGCGTAAQSV